ncbi:acyl-CoA synthetase family member 3, mitochondrial-like [Argonauta hians]
MNIRAAQCYRYFVYQTLKKPLSLIHYQRAPLLSQFHRFKHVQLSNPILPTFYKAKNYLERIALVDQNGHFRYKDILHYSSLLSKKIKNILGSTQNNNKGLQIAFLCENDMSYVVTKWAIWMNGAAAVPLCKTHPVKEICYFIDNSKSSIVIVSEEFRNLTEEIEESTGVETLLLNKEEYLHNYDPCQNYWLTECKDMDKEFEKMLGVNQFKNQPALIIYTSGTTGKPKGVVLTHGNLTAQIEGMIYCWGWTKNDVILHVLPLHHVHGIVNVLMTPFHCGATCVMLTKFDPQMVWSRLLNPVGANDGLRINLFMAVPTIYAKMIENYESSLRNSQENMYMAKFIKNTCQSRIRLMVSGSASLPQPIMERWEEITGHRLLERYGMSEIGMALSNPLDGPRLPGTVGQPMPWVNVCIAKPNVYSKYGYDVIAEGNSSKTSVTSGMESEQGELYVRGPNVFPEYFHRPDATSRSFTKDGWFKTGDTAIYENGVYSIMGRTSVDIIKSGGYKISALYVERHLLSHPQITDCAVIGLPDITWGQRIAAVLVLKEGAEEMSLENLQNWAENLMPYYQVPTVVRYLKSMPRNAMGKVNKVDILTTVFPECNKSSRTL